MPKKYLVNIDLSKNELQNAVLQPLASAPSNPAEGQLYYNTTDDTPYIYANGAWLDLGVQGGAGATDLGATLSASNVIVTSNTGADATIPAVDGTNAGVMTPTQKTKLDGIEAGAQVNEVGQADIDAAIANLVNSAPGTLDTLKELADALGDDPNYATTISGQIGGLDTRLDAVEANGGPTKKYSTTVGGSTSITVTHNLGSQDVVTQVRQASDNAVVECDIINATTNTVSLGFAVAPAANSLKVVVIG